MAWSGGDTIDKALSRMGFASSGSSGASSLGLGYDPTAAAMGFGDFMGQKYGVDPTSIKSMNGLGGDMTMIQSQGPGLGYDPTNPTKGPIGFSGDPTQPGSGFADLDAYWNKKNAEWAAQMAGPSGGGVVPPGSAVPIGGGAVTSLGGDWANIDKLSADIARAAAEVGVDPNQMKAIMKLESGGVWQTSPAGAIGYMQVMPFWGDTFGLNLNDPYQNLVAGAKVLKENLDMEGGNFYEALRRYHGYGWDGFTDDKQYADIVTKNYQQLTSAGGSAVGSQVGAGIGGNAVVAKAMEYVGKVPYVWGGIPGKGQDPSGGWDCSGMTYWLDQNYGDGSLPMGSHYQYDYAQRTGKLFTDLSQLQPGDLIFINTGWQGGAGGEMNAAGHVGIYAGNGKMVHAANPSVGTIISDLAAYNGGGSGTVLGAMHSSYSGGSGAGFAGTGTGSAYTGNAGGTSYNNAMMNALLIPGWHW
jgi:cell wall-associated NlpC family hydrolase